MKWFCGGVVDPFFFFFSVSLVLQFVFFFQVRTKIPKEAEPGIMCYLDGSKESENLSAKQIIVKLKEDFAVICGDPKPVKKKKLFGGGLFGALKKKTDVNTSDETSTAETKEASKNNTAIDDSMTSSQSGSTSTVSALPTEPVAVLHKSLSLQTGDAVNGGSRYAAPTPIKTGNEAKKEKVTKPKYNLLPLVRFLFVFLCNTSCMSLIFSFFSYFIRY